MKYGPSLEPTMRADRSLDAALLTVVIALFVAAGFGLKELPGGASEWMPKEWKGVHDCAKGLILPLLALRFGLALSNRSEDRVLRNRILTAMGLCWIGDVTLTFSGETAFLIGLVSFLAGHVMFLQSFRHLFTHDWGWSPRRVQIIAGALLCGLLPVVAHSLWEPAGDLAPAVMVYAFVITAMAYASWRLASGPGVLLLRLGTTAFLASDLILAFGRFGEAPIPNGHFWVMGTYIVAQWALTVGFTEVALHRGASRP